MILLFINKYTQERLMRKRGKKCIRNLMYLLCWKQMPTGHELCVGPSIFCVKFIESTTFPPANPQCFLSLVNGLEISYTMLIFLLSFFNILLQCTGLKTGTVWQSFGRGQKGWRLNQCLVVCPQFLSNQNGC